MLVISRKIENSEDRPAEHGSREARLTAWSPREELEHPQWVAAGRRLGAIGRANQWWIGDWLLYGSAKWDEKYATASRVTGYDVGSLRNMASLASLFGVSRRRDNLTWCHHAAVAGLDLAEQEYWLDRAAALRLSVADLRTELRAARHGVRRAAKVERPEESGRTANLVCPNCGHTVALSGSRAHRPSIPQPSAKVS